MLCTGEWDIEKEPESDDKMPDLHTRGAEESSVDKYSEYNFEDNRPRVQEWLHKDSSSDKEEDMHPWQKIAGIRSHLHIQQQSTGVGLQSTGVQPGVITITLKQKRHDQYCTKIGVTSKARYQEWKSCSEELLDRIIDFEEIDYRLCM